MGTNYYININPNKQYHIGKSSYGWNFSLHVEPSEGINSLQDIKRLWVGKTIQDEYDDVVTKRKMLNLITKRQHGLSRHEVSQFCIGHGPGTWDLLIGEFC